VEIQTENLTDVGPEASRMKGGYPFRFRLSHLLVRFVATVNIAHLLMVNYLPYLHAAHSLLGWLDVRWMTVSSFLLPLYVGVETWWMLRADPPQKRALLIDWAFAVIWFAMWWGSVLYSIYKYFPMV
jgi:hypothetical protein